jgi:rare lipoprotein A
MSVRLHRLLSLALTAAAVVLGAGLTACSYSPDRGDSAPTAKRDISTVGDAVPRREPRSKRGNPKSYVVFGKRYYTLGDAAGFVEKGIASWYGKKFHGRSTSSGEKYDMYAMTAAHKRLPLPTYVRVTNLDNDRSIVVRVNDRGPFHEGRVIDLSYTAALKLDIVRAGTAPVEVRALVPGEPAPEPRGGGQIFVQAGAFAHPSNAKRLRDELTAHFRRPITVIPTHVNGRDLHRVRIGPIDTVAVADQLLGDLGKLGVDGARLVVE